MYTGVQSGLDVLPFGSLIAEMGREHTKNPTNGNKK
jgi:hypothetical protein